MSMNHNLEPNISIIIPTYNGRKFLKRMLESIKRLYYKPHLEVIAVDNNSKDGTIKLLKQYQNDINLRIIVNQKNYGFAKACNIGAKLAKNKFLFTTNQDMIFPKHFFEKLLDIWNEINKDHPVIISPAIIFENDGIHYFGAKNHIFGFSYTPELGRKLPDKEILKETQRISGGSLFIRKKLFLELGGFDESYFMYYEDTDFSLRCLRFGYKLYTTNKISLIHQKHEWELTSFTYFLLERNRYILLFKNFKNIKKLIPYFLILEIVLILQSIFIKKFSIRIRIYYQLLMNREYLKNIRKKSKNLKPLLTNNFFSKKLDPMLLGNFKENQFFQKFLILFNFFLKLVN